MTYVISNLHGNYQKYKAMLSEISFKDTDILYVLGDIVDYGEESMELIADMSMRYNVYPVVGEHDYRAIRMLQGFDRMLKSGDSPDPDYIAEMTAWMADGGKATLDGFRALDEEMREGVIDYLSDLALYEEVEVKGKTYLLVHAGIADFDPDADLDDYMPEDFFTEPASLGATYYTDKTIVVGHVPTETGKIERGESVIAIDCGVSEGGKLACLCLENGKEFYV